MAHGWQRLRAFEGSGRCTAWLHGGRSPNIQSAGTSSSLHRLRSSKTDSTCDSPFSCQSRKLHSAPSRGALATAQCCLGAVAAAAASDRTGQAAAARSFSHAWMAAHSMVSASVFLSDPGASHQKSDLDAFIATCAPCNAACAPCNAKPRLARTSDAVPAAVCQQAQAQAHARRGPAAAEAKCPCLPWPFRMSARLFSVQSEYGCPLLNELWHVGRALVWPARRTRSE